MFITRVYIYRFVLFKRSIADRRRTAREQIWYEFLSETKLFGTWLALMDNVINYIDRPADECSSFGAVSSFAISSFIS